MPEISDGTRHRCSQLFAAVIARHEDDALRQVIEDYDDPLIFEPIEDRLISAGAWAHVASRGIAPQRVFAHPDLLCAHPRTSAYYRGIALLSRKRVSQEAGVTVGPWEIGTRTRVTVVTAHRVARFYNLAISSIIEGTADWALENGYRNIVATMGITLDGMWRNQLGRIAEALVKERLVAWLKRQGVLAADAPDTGARTACLRTRSCVMARSRTSSLSGAGG